MEFEKRTQLMRQTMSSVTPKSLSGGNIAELTAEDKSRVALLIFPAFAGTVEFSTDPNFAAGTSPFLPNGSNVPVLLNIWDHGDIVTKKLYCRSSGTALFGIIETFAVGW